MEKKNNSGILIGILIGLVIALIVVGGLLATNKIILTKQETENNNVETISYKVEDYITTEKVNIDEETINVERVLFKNLDSSLTQKFTEEQANLIESAKSTYYYFHNKTTGGVGYLEGTKYWAKSNIWYQINKNILTVHYELKSINEIAEASDIAVINIDLSNKKRLTNEEMLKLGNSSFNDIATKRYDNLLKSCIDNNKQNECYDDKNGKKVSVDELQNNKKTFINNIEVKLEDLIKAYIQDGKIKYDYQPAAIVTINQVLYAGGPFNYSTEELGEYK